MDWWIIIGYNDSVATQCTPCWWLWASSRGRILHSKFKPISYIYIIYIFSTPFWPRHRQTLLIHDSKFNPISYTYIHSKYIHIHSSPLWLHYRPTLSQIELSGDRFSVTVTPNPESSIATVAPRKHLEIELTGLSLHTCDMCDYIYIYICVCVIHIHIE